MSMACLLGCCQLPEDEEKTPLIIDVSQVLSDYAWTTFTSRLGYFAKKCNQRKKFIIEVPMNYFAFDPIGKPEYKPIDQLLLPFCAVGVTPVKKSGKAGEQNDVAATTSNSGSKQNTETDSDERDTSQDTTQDETISLDTTFHNDTAENQTYQFKFSKTRTSKVEVSYQKGFTVSGKANFTIGLPKSMATCALGLSAERKYEVKDSHGETFVESITMEATSDIKVGPQSQYVAKVLLEERAIHSNFTVRVRMSMPQKRAPIYIRRRSDKTPVCVLNICNLTDVFFDDDESAVSLRYPSVQRIKENGEYVWNKVDFVVEGQLKGSLACDHTINLTSDETDDQKQMAKNQRFQKAGD